MFVSAILPSFGERASTGQMTDGLWINPYGGMMSYKGIRSKLTRGLDFLTVIVFSMTLGKL